MDIFVKQFEDQTDNTIERINWGLPNPNLEASYKSLSKYAKFVLPLSEVSIHALNLAAEFMERHFGPYMCNSRIKTVSEVMLGLDYTTSPGFPWTQFAATKGELVDRWGEVVPDKTFEQYMEEDWDALLDINYRAVFGNSLKEEIRKREKIEQNKLRTFTAGPIEATIHGNRLFEDQNEKFYASNLKTASVVGRTPYYQGWDAIYRKLSHFATGWALDETEYDSSIRNYMMWAMARFRWRMLREADQTTDNLRRLLTYYSNLINTVIVTAEGVLVMKQGGNPSGSVNTIADNTLILYMLLAYAWLKVAPLDNATYEQFNSQVRLALCGDDNTWTASEAVQPFYNARAVINQWNHLGIITTTDSLEPRPVEELDFLSAHTTFINGVAVPLYEREKLLTSLLYTEQPRNPAYSLIRICAILRAGWVDEGMRRYARAYIDYLLKRFDHILYNDPDWIEAKAQIPTESHLRNLFLGTDTCRNVERSNSGIKTIETILEQAQSKPGTINHNMSQPKPQRKKNKSFSTKKTADRKAKALAEAELKVAQTLAVVAKTAGRPTKMGARKGPAKTKSHPKPSNKHGDARSKNWANVTEVVGSGISVDATTTAGKILFTAPLRVDSYPGTALNQEMFLWEQWKLQSWTFHFTSTVSDFDAGQLLAFFEPDPDVTYTDSPDNVRLGYARTTRRPLKIRKDGTITFVPDPADAALRYCLAKTSDLRLVSYGTFYVVYVGGSKFATPTNVYTVTNEQRISWFKRDLDAIATGGSGPAQAKVTSTTATIANLLLGATASDSGLPVSVDGLAGTLSIADGTVGSANNVLLDVMAEIKNNSGVRMATQLLSDFGINPLDSFASTDVVEPGAITEAISQFLFPSGFDVTKLAVSAAQGALMQVLKSQVRASLVPKWITSLKHKDLHMYGAVTRRTVADTTSVSSLMVNECPITELIAAPASNPLPLVDSVILKSGFGDISWSATHHVDGMYGDCISRIDFAFTAGAPSALIAVQYRITNNKRKFGTPHFVLTNAFSSATEAPQWEVKGTGDPQNGSWDLIYRGVVVNTATTPTIIGFDVGEFLFQGALWSVDVQYVDPSVPITEARELPQLRRFFNAPSTTSMMRSEAYIKPDGSDNPWFVFPQHLTVNQGFFPPITQEMGAHITLKSPVGMGIGDGFLCVSGNVQVEYSTPVTDENFLFTDEPKLTLHSHALIKTPSTIFLYMFKVNSAVTADHIVVRFHNSWPQIPFTCKSMQIVYCANDQVAAYKEAMMQIDTLRARALEIDDYVNIPARRTPQQHLRN